jgi:hypothetical protein
MSFKHTNQVSLSAPIGISMGLLPLLAAGLIFLFWKNSQPKTEMPSIFFIPNQQWLN